MSVKAGIFTAVRRMIAPPFCHPDDQEGSFRGFQSVVETVEREIPPDRRDDKKGAQSFGERL
jgi:hypothetical protein